MTAAIRFLAWWATLAVASSPAGAEWVEWIAEGSLETEYEDNVNHTAFSEDEQDEFYWRPEVSLGRVYQASDDVRVSLTTDVEGMIFKEFDRLNAARMGGTVAVDWKLGLGSTAPRLRAHAFGGYFSVRDGPRSGPFAEAGLEVGKRFGERFDASLAYLYHFRDGRAGQRTVLIPRPSTEVWDQEQHEVTLRGSFLVTDRLLFGAHWSYRDGDFDSQAAIPNVRGEVLRREGSNIGAVARDDVFGGWVYRLEGHQNVVGASLNYQLADRWSVDLGYSYLMGKGRELNYRVNQASIGVLFRY